MTNIPRNLAEAGCQRCARCGRVFNKAVLKSDEGKKVCPKCFDEPTPKGK